MRDLITRQTSLVAKIHGRSERVKPAMPNNFVVRGGARVFASEQIVVNQILIQIEHAGKTTHVTFAGALRDVMN
jgi:hypothetical protein